MPYPLINCGMNMAGSTGPSTLDRKAESFTIAPFHSGSALTGWFETKDRLGGMRVSEAAAISGSAFSPNMGMHNKPILSVLLTLVNGRLGKWIRHPGGFFRFSELDRKQRPDTERFTSEWHADGRGLLSKSWLSLWRFAQQVVSYLLLYWRDMFGAASHEDGLVFIADGGHFENTGIYELLRRRCKYIVFVDESGDTRRPQPFDFGGLAFAMRRARVDFGVEIDIDLGPLMCFQDDTPAARQGRSGRQWATGTIQYPKSGGDSGDDASRRGTIMVIKGALTTERLPADIIHYATKINPGFPDDSTADQQFDQPQFESYRKLGFMAGDSAAGAIRAMLPPHP